MIIVTGGAGFIGSNLIRSLNYQGYTKIIIVDDLNFKNKKNIQNLHFDKIYGIDYFISLIKKRTKKFKNTKVLFHQGACSNTMEKNVSFLMKYNFNYSKTLLDYCSENKIKFIYASSASVYGMSRNTLEIYKNEEPLNLYAISKLMFDNYVRLKSHKHFQVVGLRYFNVYGNGEQHKNKMASVIHHFFLQAKSKSNTIKIFGASHGYKAGFQSRDFIYIDDVININLWFMNNNLSGIYNVGTGSSQKFNNVAKFINKFKKSKIKYIKFPEKLIDNYQPYTKADIRNLRNIGYKKNFTSLKSGIMKYINEK